MTRLVLALVRPYRGWLGVVFAAMLVETLMSLAAPWPLKIVLDNALGHHPLPEWLEWVQIKGLKVGASQVDLRFERSGDLSLAVVTSKARDLQVMIEY